MTLKTIAIIDADLITRKKHRFPNLACMKISAAYKKMGYDVSLKTDFENLMSYEKVMISKVFTDTYIPDNILKLPNVTYGGTGFFYDKAQPLPDEIEHERPDYHLYDDWIAIQLAEDGKKKDFKFYQDYSIGFITRGCYRKCGFCVNQHYNRVSVHSPLEEFLDQGRKKICLLDDNFFGSASWKVLIQALKETKKPFQFRQGLDERLLTPNKCQMLFTSKYDGDYIFAFDDIADAKLIESKIRLARQFTSATIKFYILCGYDRQDHWDQFFWKQDIFDLFLRIEILIRHQCIPYIMRYKRYVDSPYRGLYINIARWCNQPNFFKKKSLREFGIANGETSACFKYLCDFEKQFPEVAYFYDLKFEKE